MYELDQGQSIQSVLTNIKSEKIWPHLMIANGNEARESNEKILHTKGKEATTENS